MTSTVATTAFPGEQSQVPRSWGERAYLQLNYFHEVDGGGHFAAREQPRPFAEELHASFRPRRQQRSSS
jgi:pimeloyl-ACP methyl ester carboxylesterase